MDNFNLFLWIQWNPPRDAFTIPYFDLTIAWYGILFAAGFVFAYFLLLPILKKKIEQNTQLYERDITNWHLLAQQIKNQQEFKIIDSNSKQDDYTQNPLPASLKEKLLNTINTFMNSPISNCNRSKIQKLFPGSIKTSSELSILFTDRLTWYVVIGTVIGARLGHVLFYDWHYYSTHLSEILMIRQGGLASHGGTIGIILALCLFRYMNKKQFPEFSLLAIIDALVIPTCIAGACIRLGNFMNQEILGNQTDLPWAIIFKTPADHSMVVPRHPAQLYEAICYIAIFFVLFSLWKIYDGKIRTGILSGLFFVLVFGSRFFIEFLKEPQGSIIDESFLQMGQYLSIPFILLGFLLLMRRTSKLSH